MYIYGGKVIPLTGKGACLYVTAAIVHRTVTKLFVRDIYLCKFLDFKLIHEHENIYRHMPLFTNVIMLRGF